MKLPIADIIRRSKYVTGFKAQLTSYLISEQIKRRWERQEECENRQRETEGERQRERERES